MVQMHSQPPHLDSLCSIDVLVPSRRRKLDTSKGLWKVAAQRMDSPEAREGTLSIRASAELRIRNYGLKLSQSQTAVTQNSDEFTNFTHLILWRKECGIFINRIMAL